MDYNGTPRTDAFTQGCRDFIRSLTYEAILACTVYGPPMLFMIGPAAILANHAFIIVLLHSLLGFGMSCWPSGKDRRGCMCRRLSACQ
jgi:proteasome lid subunit RPN8/RPN11